MRNELGIAPTTADLVAAVLDAVEALLEAPPERQALRLQYLRDAHRALSASLSDCAMGACPKCGEALAARRGRYGAFWGVHGVAPV